MKSWPIGSLRHRVQLEVPSRDQAEAGGAVVTWEPVATLWAEIIPLSGTEVFRADGISATAAFEVRTRFRPDIPDINAEMRFVFGERVLDIKSVRDIEGRRRWLSCVCEERSS